MPRPPGEFFSSLLPGLRTILLVSAFLLWWWVHGRDERYVRIIGGPFLVMVYLGLFAAGFALTSPASIPRSLVRDAV